jgi:hypothetical protein
VEGGDTTRVPAYQKNLTQAQLTIVYVDEDTQLPEGLTRGASTIRVKFQIAPPNVLKLVELSHLSHADFRSGFGTVFQCVLWVFTLSRDR